MSRFVLVAAAVLFRLALEAAGQTVYEQVELRLLGTGQNNVINFTMANFGVIPYGTSMQGRLVYPAPDFQGGGHNCGRMPCNYGCDPLSEAIPPFRISDGKVNIVMLDRVPDQQRIALVNCSHLDKAVNAALAGADAVIIVDTDNEPNVAVAKSTPEYHIKQSSLSVPVGMIGASDGALLRSALKAAGSAPVQIHLNFLNLIKQNLQVNVEIWHDSADDCGPSCNTVRSVLKNMASMATSLEVHDKRVNFEPHFNFASYCGDACSRQCVNARYCYLGSTQYVNGADIAAENIRQACMFSVLKQSGRSASWWSYSLGFEDACKSSEYRFNAECSLKVFSSIWPDLVEPWKKCWSGLGTTDKIDVVERELLLAEGAGTLKARIILNPTVRINDQQYRGNFDKVSIFKAICSAFPDGFAPDACSTFGTGECEPGRTGAYVCSNANSVFLHRTRCVERFMGFDCKCSDGYEEMPGTAGGQCVDINECERFNLCSPTATGQRTVCVNTPGSWRCDVIRNECTKENGFGGCWQGKNSKRERVSSCIDNFPSYQAASSTGLALPPPYKCECSSIPGCWHDAGNGKCVELCPESECLADKGVCRAKPAGGLSTWVIFFIFVVCGAAIATTAVLHRRHRNSMDEHVRRLLSDYVPLESSTMDRTYSCGGDLERGFGSSKREHRNCHNLFVRTASEANQMLGDNDLFSGP